MTTDSKLREALQFYADREHYHLDEWDSVSGEPPNWLHPPESSEDQPWMVEDGSIAREALSQPTSDEGRPDTTPESIQEAADIILDVADYINDACNDGTDILGSKSVDPLMQAHALLVRDDEATSKPSDEGTPTETPLTPDDYAHIVMMRSGMLDHLTEWYADNLRKAVADVIGQALQAKERELADAKVELKEHLSSSVDYELVDGIRQLAQAAVSWQGNCETLEQKLATLQSPAPQEKTHPMHPAWRSGKDEEPSTTPAALSSGYVQVPVEPTQDWLDSVANRLGIGDAEMRELHSALLAATTTPSDSKPGEGKCQDQ